MRTWLVLFVMFVAACSKRHEPEARQRVGTEAPERVLRAVRVSASSEHVPNPGYTFVVTNLVDGALNTSWQPAPADHAQPQWVRLDFDNDVVITAVAVANGFQVTDRYGDEFLLNRRVARARLRFSDGTEAPIQFSADARGYTRFPVAKKITRSIELLVDSTFPGTKWNDLAVSEIEVRGASPELAAMPIAGEPSAARPVGPSTAVEEQWWTPPAGDRKSVDALAYGFAGIDEKDLGEVFTADLKPIYGAPKLFEDKPPRRVVRDEMQKVVFKLRDSSQLDGGFRWLFLKAGASYERERDYQVVRAMQISDVVRLDETARMRRPPDQAVFYLAEVHRGASFDLLVDGRRSAMGAQLELLFGQGEGTARNVSASGSYKLKAFGLGLRDFGGDGIFAMSPEGIAKRYRTGTPVPVQLVFRTIPGRDYKPVEYPVPTPVIDEPAFVVAESARRSWTVSPGTYWLEASSEPNGMYLNWDGSVACNAVLTPNTEYKHISQSCVVAETARLNLVNPSTFNLGPAETMSLYVETR